MKQFQLLRIQTCVIPLRMIFVNSTERKSWESGSAEFKKKKIKTSQTLGRINFTYPFQTTALETGMFPFGGTCLSPLINLDQMCNDGMSGVRRD